MNKLILFFAVFAYSLLPLHGRISLPESDPKKVVAVVGSDITALWSAYFLMQETDKEQLPSDWEIHLIGEDLNLDSDLPLLMPMMTSGNIPEMFREERTRQEIQDAISLQSKNQKLLQHFLSRFDVTDWKGKRRGSYLAVANEDSFNQGFYEELFFRFKLPLTHVPKEELPTQLNHMFSADWELFHTPFDSVIDETLLRRLLLSYLLEERADKPRVQLHLTTCINLFEEGDDIVLGLENGEIFRASACVIDLETKTLPLIQTLSPGTQYETVLEAVLIAEGFGFELPQPCFVQFPSEDITITFGENQRVYFYRKLVGLCHDEMKSMMILKAQDLYPGIDDLDFRLSTLYRPVDHSSPLLLPFGKGRPIVVINQDQSERISKGATMGELGCKALLECLLH